MSAFKARYQPIFIPNLNTKITPSEDFNSKGVIFLRYNLELTYRRAQYARYSCLINVT